MEAQDMRSEGLTELERTLLHLLYHEGLARGMGDEVQAVDMRWLLSLLERYGYSPSEVKEVVVEMLKKEVVFRVGYNALFVPEEIYFSFFE